MAHQSRSSREGALCRLRNTQPAVGAPTSPRTVSPLAQHMGTHTGPRGPVAAPSFTAGSREHKLTLRGMVPTRVVGSAPEAALQPFTLSPSLSPST